MRWVVYILVILALAIWILVKKLQMNREEKELNKWLKSNDLTRYNKDPFGLISVFQRAEWVMNLNSIYKVIHVSYRTRSLYIFNADKKISERRYRTYGCVLINIPRHKALLLFSKNRSDLDKLGSNINLKRLDHFKGERLTNLFNIYAADAEDALRVLSLLESVLFNDISEELIIEIRDDNLLILLDEYFKFTDIEKSLALAKRLNDVFIN